MQRRTINFYDTMHDTDFAIITIQREREIKIKDNFVTGIYKDQRIIDNILVVLIQYKFILINLHPLVAFVNLFLINVIASGSV